MNWKWVRLCDIGQIVGGGTPSTSVPSFWNDEIAWITPADLSGYSEKYISKGRKSISSAGLINSGAKLLPKGSIVFSSRAPIGYVALASNPLATNQGFKSIVPSELVLPEFVYYYLKSAKWLAEEQASGTTFLEISARKFGELPFPLAPLTDQHRIVAKLDTLFADLERAVAHLQAARERLKTYRQSVLKWAFEGRLTNKDVEEGELPRDWKILRIEEVATVRTGATPLKGNKSFYENGRIAWVTSGALNGEYVTEASDFVTEKALRETNLRVYPKHTLLLAMYGEGKTRGKCSELLIEACTNQAIAAIDFTEHDSSIRPYLKYYLLKNYDDLRRLSSGGVQPNLNLSIVKKTPLPIPPREEQKLIVKEVGLRLEAAKKIETQILIATNEVERLKQSILERAFEGELTQ